MFKVGDKVVPNGFDFDNYFYVLELNDSTTFIATYEGIDKDIWGLSDEDETDTSFIKKVLSRKS